ncbi:MAG TPA: glycosyltransferase family 2 protein [Thermoleophilaceae bacterium]|nr:glycosyltransferase family 2 protein [Thermoleophilaceae bacterium]
MLRALFWTASGLLAYAHAGYPAVLWLLVHARGAGRRATGSGGSDFRSPPVVSLIVAAHDEEDVIAARVANARALDYPPERLELIVASDGSTDRTADRARSAGADLVLDLPRGGKVVAQDRAVERAHGDLLAFSDANSAWAPDALRRLVGPFADLAVGYVCGKVAFHGGDGTSEEGLYWRYENAVRELESRLGGVTAGNGAIYAVRRSAYMRLDPRTSHDLSFPFNMVRRGWLALYEPAARAEEAMAPTVEGEFRRKRRMMRHAWPTVLGGGLVDPRGYGPLYALEVASHRLLRYASPALHLAVLGSSAALARRGGRPYAAALGAQVGVLAAAAAAPAIPFRPARLARYYVLVTAAVAAGLWDHLRAGTPSFWDRAEGTR